MFKYCSSLTSTPDLTTVQIVRNNGFNQMFSECTGLTSASKINATIFG